MSRVHVQNVWSMQPRAKSLESRVTSLKNSKRHVIPIPHDYSSDSDIVLCISINFNVYSIYNID